MSYLKVYKSNVTGKVPSVNDLDLESIGINSVDGLAWIKKRSESGVESIVPLGGGSSGGSDHVRLHAINDPLDHAPVSAEYRDKILHTNATTGVIDFVSYRNDVRASGSTDSSVVTETGIRAAIEEAIAGSSSGTTTLIREVPSGLINGVNKEFILSQSAISQAYIFLYVNGVSRSDFSYNTETRTITIDFAPTTGSEVYVQYFRAVSAGSEFDAQNLEFATLRKATGNSYSTITYTDGLVTKIELFSDAAKTVKIFTVDYTRVDGVITTVVVTDEATGKVQTTTYTRTDGVIVNVNVEVV